MNDSFEPLDGDIEEINDLFAHADKAEDDEAMEQTTHLLTFLEQGFYDG